MADLKMGTTVAGSTIWSQSNLPLLPSGNRLTFKGWKVYTETDKPTAEDIGSLSLANGGTVAKNTTFGQSITVADNVTATEVYLSSGETIARSGNSAFINFKRTDLTNTPVQETTVQSINAYDGNSQLMSAYTVSKLTSGGNKIYLRGYKDGIQNTLLTIDTQSQQVSVEQGTFRVVGATTLSSLNATSATISGDVSAQKITPTDWSNIDQRYMTGYMKNFTGSSFGSVVDKNDVYTINGTLLSDGPKGNATYVGILVNYRSTRNTGVSLIQKYFDSDGVTYIRKGVGSTSAYVWIGGDANGWSKIYDTSNKPTLVELNAARSGINDDITSLTALSGSLRLGGDAQSAYDAVTLRQLQAATAGGSGGASMSGVMNNFIGAVEWFQGTRAKLPAGYIAADGQEESQTDPNMKDLFAAVDSDMLVATTEQIWQSDKRWRGSYVKNSSPGKFRVPDLNGVTSGSIPSPFLRGQSGSLLSGTIQENAAPNIHGSSGNDISGKVWFPAGKSVTGALGFAPSTELTFYPNDGTFNRVNNNATLIFDASRSNPAYGRDNTTEVRPNSAVGIWIIRANGNFSAANTNWFVINGDTQTPPNETVVYGGDVWSAYQVAGSDYTRVGLRSKVTIGGESTGELRLIDNRPGGSDKVWTLPPVSGTILTSADIGTSGDKIPKLNVQNVWTKTQVFQESGVVTQTVLPSDATLNDRGGPHFVSYIITGNQIRLGAKFFSSFDSTNLRRAVIQVTTDNDQSAQVFSLDQRGDIASSKGNVQFTGSDVRIKNNFTLVKEEKAWERISKVGVTEYAYNEDERIRRGFIAQQMDTVDDKYTFFGGESTDENGESFKIMNVDQTAVLADAILVIQQLQNKVIELEKQIANS